MKIALLGLQGAGKKTLFKLLTGSDVTAVPAKGLPGVVSVRDPRVDALSALCHPQKTTYARMDMLLLPDVEKTEGKAVWLDDVRNLDGIVFVARAFPDPSVFHPSGSVDARRDLDTFLSELVFADLFLMERRKDKLAQEMRAKTTPEKTRELEVIKKVIAGLEAGKTVRNMGLTEPEKAVLFNYQFLTDKAIAAVVNISQDAADPALRAALEKEFGSRMSLSFFDVKLEAEIAGMDDPKERAEFLSGMGIGEPAFAVLTRGVYEALGLMSYYTFGEDEVRAWTVRKGSTAPQAARAIHRDLEKGFIRAEHMKFADLIALGSEAKVKEAGKFSLKGKDYIVEDGDVLSFRAAN